MGHEINGITERVIGAAIEVHRRLGPGLLESAYQVCFAAELGKRGISFLREVSVPVVYDDVRLDSGYRLDFLVEGQVVVELKSVASLAPIFEAQVLTYLKLGGWTVGLLINFNVRYLGEGAVRRLVNGYTGPLPRDSAMGGFQAPSAAGAVCIRTASPRKRGTGAERDPGVDALFGGEHAAGARLSTTRFLFVWGDRGG